MTNDNATQVTTKENVTPLVTTVSFSTANTTTVESLLVTGLETSSVVKKVKSPLIDPKTSWIYVMNKDALIAKMSKHGLLTTGNVDMRRRRLTNYWRTAATQLPHPDFTTRLTARPDSLTSDGASGWPEAGEQHIVVYQHLANESANIRKILGLSPNADSTTVRRAC